MEDNAGNFQIQVQWFSANQCHQKLRYPIRQSGVQNQSVQRRPEGLRTLRTENAQQGENKSGERNCFYTRANISQIYQNWGGAINALTSVFPL